MKTFNGIEMSNLLKWPNSPKKICNVLLCFPHAGGGASFYSPWLAECPNHLVVVPVQLPGREDRIKEDPYKRMDDLLNALFLYVPYFLEKNIYLFGHSMGAIIATAFSKKLLDNGIMPKHLFVSGSVSPHYRDFDNKLHHLDKEQFWDRILSLNGTPVEIASSPDLRLMMERRLRADLELCENWSLPPNQRLSCELSVLYGDHDPFINKSGLAGWQELTVNQVSYKSFSGGHFYLKQDMSRILDFISQNIRM